MIILNMFLLLYNNNFSHLNLRDKESDYILRLIYREKKFVTHAANGFPHLQTTTKGVVYSVIFLDLSFLWELIHYKRQCGLFGVLFSIRIYSYLV